MRQMFFSGSLVKIFLLYFWHFHGKDKPPRKKIALSQKKYNLSQKLHLSCKRKYAVGSLTIQANQIDGPGPGPLRKHVGTITKTPWQEKGGSSGCSLAYPNLIVLREFTSLFGSARGRILGHKQLNR